MRSTKLVDDSRMRALCAVLTALLSLASCTVEQPTPTCENRRPDGYGRMCRGDGECASYLKCIQSECALPPTMSGLSEPTSVQLAFRPQPEHDAFLTFDAEQAATELERRRGLSFRPCMQPGWAMLFVYPDESTTISHQTLDMRYDIDIAFVSESGVVQRVYRDLEAGSVESIGTDAPVKYVIETRAGALGPVAGGDTVGWGN
ncbi:MAG: DUF192 domain-containing protein [Myxococcota bacterium]